MMSGCRSVNFADLCRLCIASSGTKIHIFSEEGKRKGLRDKITKCLPLKVEEQDLLPKQLCAHCVEKVETFSSFHETALRSQQMLQTCISSKARVQNGGKDVPQQKKAATVLNIVKTEGNTNTYQTTSQDFLSSIVQTSGIQAYDDGTDNQIVTLTVPANSQPQQRIQVNQKMPQYQIVFDGSGLKLEPTNTITTAEKQQQSQAATLSQVNEFIKINPSKTNTIQEKKQNINFVLTSPTSGRQEIQTVQTSSGTVLTSGQQNYKIISPNKCVLPVTIKKEPAEQQQLIAQIDGNNVVLPTYVQMRVQPQYTTVDGQQLFQLAPAMPTTLTLAQSNNNQIIATPTSQQIHIEGSDKKQTILFATNVSSGQQNIQSQQIYTQSISGQQIVKTIPQSTNVTKLTTLQSNNLSMIKSNQISVQRIPASTANQKFVKVKAPVKRLPDPLKIVVAKKPIAKQEKPTTVKTAGTGQKGDVPLPPPVTCDQCGKVFKRKEHLVQHAKLHQGLRPFKCDQPNCDKAFSRKEHLMRHIVSHTGKKMFRCEQCHKLFSRKDNLNKHKRSHEAKAQQQQQQIQIQQQVKENTEDSFTISAI